LKKSRVFSRLASQSLLPNHSSPSSEQTWLAHFPRDGPFPFRFLRQPLSPTESVFLDQSQPDRDRLRKSSRVAQAFYASWRNQFFAITSAQGPMRFYPPIGSRSSALRPSRIDFSELALKLKGPCRKFFPFCFLKSGPSSERRFPPRSSAPPTSKS